MTRDVETRVAANVEARSRNVVEDAHIRRCFALAVAKQFGAGLQKARSSATRLRMTTPVLKRVDYVAQSLAWMSRSESSFGQQALQTATKALRALQAGRATFAELESLSKDFRSLKRAQERRNAEAKPRAPRTLLALCNGWSAGRIVTERDLMSLGRRFGNCLAAGEHSKTHRKLLRDGQCQYWVIANNISEPRCILQINRHGRHVVEIKGPGNEAPYDSCDAVLEFMAKRNLTAGYDDDLADLGISDDLISAVSAAEVQVLNVVLSGAKWKLRVAPGILVGHSEEGTFTLRGQPEDDDYFSASRLNGYTAVAQVRCGLRKVCKEDPLLAHTFASAFKSAQPILVQDWFGLDTYDLG